MGSGAFLVEACRQLARKLVEGLARAWRAAGHPPGEDDLLHARRLLEPLGHNPLAILPPAAFEAHYSHQLHEAAMVAWLRQTTLRETRGGSFERHRETDIMATPWSKTHRSGNHTFRKFRDGDHRWPDLESQIFEADHSHKCPTYVHRTPPCQGSCPSGEDVRGWLQIVRGLEKPPEGMSWQEYAFRRATDANPFPAQMGRVCPAPCEDGCNRNEVEDFVGINSVEQFIGDTAIAESFAFEPPARETGKRIAVVGGGPAGLAAAYQLRRRGHRCTVYDDHEALGGMMRYGIPGYRTPRQHLDHEIDRILALGGIEARLSTRVGRDVGIEEVEAEHDAVLWTIGCQSGRPLPIPGGDAPNCVSGVKFLEAFNEGRLQVAANRVVCVGGGDTSIDVVSWPAGSGASTASTPRTGPKWWCMDSSRTTPRWRRRAPARR